MLNEYATLVGHTNINGQKGYYKTWHYDIDGDEIASRYERLNLTPEQVEAIIDNVNRRIDDAIDDIIDDALDEFLGC